MYDIYDTCKFRILLLNVLIKDPLPASNVAARYQCVHTTTRGSFATAPDLSHDSGNSRLGSCTVQYAKAYIIRMCTAPPRTGGTTTLVPPVTNTSGAYVLGMMPVQQRYSYARHLALACVPVPGMPDAWLVSDRNLLLVRL